ncbi:MAG: hypothetical protein RL563_1412 [Pseudomonadota bacterium]
MVNDHSVIGLIQAVIASHRAQYALMTVYERQSLGSQKSILASIRFKESTMVLSRNGHYADPGTVLSLLNEVVTERESRVF